MLKDLIILLKTERLEEGLNYIKFIYIKFY